MRKLVRPALDTEVIVYLDSETQTIVTDADPKAKADDRWKSKNREHFKHIRSRLELMASGRARCMYCDDSGGTDIDHFAPKANYPNRAFTWANYLLACSHCNSNAKRTQFPLDASGHEMLIDPSVDDPLEHLALIPSTGEFAARTDRGTESIKVFALNRAVLCQGRVDAWNAASALVRQYAMAADSDAPLAEMYNQTLQNASFSVVLLVMEEYAHSSVDVLPSEVRQALNSYPELTNWV